METDIPPELLSPTVEELEKRTAQDLETEWKPCKRPGKKERLEIKKEGDKPKEPATNSLSSLFSKNEKPKDSYLKPKPPTLRVSLGSPSKPIVPDVPPNRKRGRPPKVNSL